MVAGGVPAAAVVLAVWLCAVAAQPRCRAKGQYQDANMIFSCYGSTVNSDSDSQNRFTVAFGANEEKIIAIVPQGTVNFRITMQPLKASQDVPMQLLVEKTGSGENIVRDKLQVVQLPTGSQDHKFEYTVHGDFKITYWEYLTHPRSQQVVFHSASTENMTIKAKNKMSSPQLYRFEKFHYDAYRTGTESREGVPMCAYGAMPDGCKLYKQEWVRQYATAFCNDVKNKYRTPEEAWEGMAPDPGSPTIPYYYWEQAWRKVSLDIRNKNGRNMWKVYKFLSHGGFEAAVLHVDRPGLDFCYRLDKVDAFAKAACKFFTDHYSDANAVWAKAEEWAQQGRRLTEMQAPVLEEASLEEYDRHLMAYNVSYNTTSAPQVCDIAFLGNGYCFMDPNEDASHRIGNWVGGSTEDATAACCNEPSCQGFHWTGNFYVLLDAVGTPNGVHGRQCWSRQATTTASVPTPTPVVTLATTTGVVPTPTPLVPTPPPATTPAPSPSPSTRVRDPVMGIWDMIKNLPNAPSDPSDYLERYLNADGYQGVLPQDLEYCWNPASLTTPKPWTVTYPPTPRVTTSIYKPARHCYAHLQKAAYKGDLRIEVDDAMRAKFHGSQDGQPGSSITIGSVEDHRIFAVESSHILQLSRKIESAFPVGTRVHSKDCYATTLTTSVLPPQRPVTPTLTTTIPTATGCHWTSAPQCAATFVYKGQTITGCTLLDAQTPGAWCSDTAVYAGSFHKCEWDCPNPQSCAWVKDQGCVDKFTYQGHMLGPCTKFRYHTVWCSHDAVFQAASNWRYCTWKCGCFWKPDYRCVTGAWTYQGVTHNGCIVADQHGNGWCSHDATFSGHWSSCTKYCPEPTDDYGVIPKPTIVSATTCNWTPVPECKFPFVYQGRSYDQCITIGHKGAWCSTDSNYVGHWAHCKWKCGIPEGLQCKYEIAPGCVQNFSYSGAVYAGCHIPDAQHRQPWCSTASAYTPYSGQSKTCSYGCPCFWVPDPDCSLSWSQTGDRRVVGQSRLDPAAPSSGSTALGQVITQGSSYSNQINGCLPTNDGRAWCATSPVYDGHFRWCAWACMRVNASTLGYLQSGGDKSDLGLYAGVGAGIGAGVGALGLGAYGIYKAVESSQNRRRVASPASQLAALEASDVEKRKLLSTYDVDRLSFVTPFAGMIAMVSLFCIVSVSLFLKRRSKSRRSSQEQYFIRLE